MSENETLRYFERTYGPFTHMGAGDKAIWLRYLQQGGGLYSPFEYDVRVGDGTIMPDGSSDYAVKAAYALTTKRIDVICVHNGIINIIEVKDRAGLSAIGQLIGYRDLFIRSTAPTMPVQMWLITDRLQPDMIHVLIENQINYIEVGL